MQIAEITSVWVVDPSASIGARKLTFGTKEGGAGVVSLPNGQVVYSVEENGRLNLWTLNRDGNGNTVQLTNAGASAPATTADGKYLVYASVRTGVRHLYRLDLKTRAEVQLTDGGSRQMEDRDPAVCRRRTASGSEHSQAIQPDRALDARQQSALLP